MNDDDVDGLVKQTAPQYGPVREDVMNCNNCQGMGITTKAPQRLCTSCGGLGTVVVRNESFIPVPPGERVTFTREQFDQLMRNSAHPIAPPSRER